jgi:hypothetical protein
MLTIDILIQWYDRIDYLNSTSVEERFIWLVENRRDLLERVPDKYIARFLSMRPDTFSSVKGDWLKSWEENEMSKQK